MARSGIPAHRPLPGARWRRAAFQLCLTDKVLLTELFHVLSPLRQGDGLKLDLSESGGEPTEQDVAGIGFRLESIDSLVYESRLADSARLARPPS